MPGAEAEELPDLLTPIAPLDLADALAEAWRALLGVTPARESVLVLLAHSALETGRWKACHCYNIGNAKGAPKDGRDWTFFTCNEIVGGRAVWFHPPDPACRFRAFRSLAEGAADYLGMLRRRFATAWGAIESGDPRAFVHAIKLAGYFTADEGPYANGVAALFHQYDASLGFHVKPSARPLDDALAARVDSLVALSLRELAPDVTEPARDRDDAPPR